MDLLSRDYAIRDICSLMGVSRAGYYKWKKRPPSKRDINREKMIELVRTIHEKHRTHGYRWTAAYIRINEHIDISENYAYKCFRFLGIKSETRHQIHNKPRKVRDRYPNLIYSTWETVDRPRQVIVSDMTAVAERRGAREQYIDGLNDIVCLLKGTSEPVILHTDQGTVYASMAYNELIRDTNIVRSMSRAGKPTDNPVNEALNGWIKEELTVDFGIEGCREKRDFREVMERYVRFYNEQRPCFAIGYDTPANYRKRYNKGEIKCKETFEKRELTTEPKFVRKRRATVLSESDLGNM